MHINKINKLLRIKIQLRKDRDIINRKLSTVDNVISTLRFMDTVGNRRKNEAACILGGVKCLIRICVNTWRFLPARA